MIQAITAEYYAISYLNADFILEMVVSWVHYFSSFLKNKENSTVEGCISHMTYPTRTRDTWGHLGDSTREAQTEINCLHDQLIQTGTILKMHWSWLAMAFAAINNSKCSPRSGKDTHTFQSFMRIGSGRDCLCHQMDL